MQPHDLLHYALEKIHLPSGEALCKWIIKQPVAQTFFIYLFWLIKVKFFQKDQPDPRSRGRSRGGSEQDAERSSNIGSNDRSNSGSNDRNTGERHWDADTRRKAENYLLKKTGTENVRFIDIIATKYSAEYQKDFIFKYWPYILAHAIYYGFFYLYPGSRHIYTKQFRKTVLLQVTLTLTLTLTGLALTLTLTLTLTLIRTQTLYLTLTGLALALILTLTPTLTLALTLTRTMVNTHTALTQ